MYRGDDILKIYDQDLNNIGRATREEVHTQGLLHQVAHVWMFQPKEDDTYIMIQKRSLEAWEVLSAVKSEFETFGKVLENTQNRINQANKELDKLVGVRTRAIQRKLRNVEKLEDPSAAEAILPIDESEEQL